MPVQLDRRAFLAAALSAAATRALAQDEDSPLILRQDIPGVDPRYAAYALPGPYVTRSHPTTVDSSRSRVTVYAPERLAKGRVIVFSHGALADPTTYRALLTHWASHGFVVLAPHHADSVIERGPTLRKSGSGSLSKWPVSDLLEDASAWRDRAAACSACLDDAVLFEASAKMEFDLERPLVAGHGYGAYVAQMLLGATAAGKDDERVSLKDSRFFAGMLMSPQGPGVMGLDDASWSEVVAPLLFMVAENDLDFTGQPSNEKAKSYRLAHPGYKHMAFLKEGTANTFSGQMAGTNRREAKLFEVVRAVSTAYAMAYGSYDPQAFRDMTTEFFERMSLGAVDEGKR